MKILTKLNHGGGGGGDHKIMTPMSMGGVRSQDNGSEYLGGQLTR